VLHVVAAVPSERVMAVVGPWQSTMLRPRAWVSSLSALAADDVGVVEKLANSRPEPAEDKEGLSTGTDVAVTMSVTLSTPPSPPVSAVKYPATPGSRRGARAPAASGENCAMACTITAGKPTVVVVVEGGAVVDVLDDAGVAVVDVEVGSCSTALGACPHAAASTPSVTRASERPANG